MLSRRITVTIPKIIKRNIGITAPALQTATDPIQKLFVDKIKEYKSKSSGGKLVDASPELERERKQELEKIAKQYGGDGQTDMTQFPQFKFTEPKVDVGSSN
ncbi:ATP synthase-coupling factor 6, mitochondrial-like [Leptopilina boulardi]|uniref:ATP synthase-coupling factor 6, mitochondrial-like n=1 Tax=Leptopilina boulardi TaxID=63433 RepID=UPI0021F5E569|nr:ATP synthase-coupling factor 6, mitochondrial-like [Leptopilina boulardi]